MFIFYHQQIQLPKADQSNQSPIAERLLALTLIEFKSKK